MSKSPVQNEDGEKFVESNYFNVLRQCLIMSFENSGNFCMGHIHDIFVVRIFLDISSSDKLALC